MTTDVRVKRILDSDEPDYAALVRLGPSVLPALGRFAAGPDRALAAKAASAAGRFDDPRALEVIRRAARSASPLVRLAAASATRGMRAPAVGQVILALTRDPDPGVRKFAVKAAATRPHDAALAARVRAIQSSDPSPTIRALAARAGRSPGGRVA